MAIRRLIAAQLGDPNRGSFLVNPAPVKPTKRITVNGEKQVVQFSCNDISKKGGLAPHPDGFEFVMVPDA